MANYWDEYNVEYTDFGILMGCDDHEIRSYKIKEGTDHIGGSAFVGCTKLESIEFPESLLRIGDSAFEGCVSLKTITLPSALEIVEDDVFNECSGLKTVYILGRETDFGYNAFADCENLETIFVPKGTLGYYEQFFSELDVNIEETDFNDF